MTPSQPQPSKPPLPVSVPPGTVWRSRASALALYAVIALAAYYLATAMVRPVVMNRPETTGGLKAGEPAPPLVATGWLNGELPSADELAGKVMVVDAWFAACPHCVDQAGELVQAHEKFHDRGVVFVGLTPDEETELQACRRFLKKTGITWPNGWGAANTLDKFLTDGGYFPAVWIVGPDGRVTWNSDSDESLEQALELALKQVKPNDANR